jgi:hypothetical protein
MDNEAYSMTGAMSEVLSETGIIEYFSASGVNIRSQNSWSTCSDSSLLSLVNRLVVTRLLTVHGADDE